MDKDAVVGCFGALGLFFFIWWCAQPNTDGVCVPEQHWWIASTLPSCASEIDDLQGRVSALEEKLHMND
jgi:hypothetical protein